MLEDPLLEVQLIKHLLSPGRGPHKEKRVPARDWLISKEKERPRVFRFVGGPAHGERRELVPSLYYFVPEPPKHPNAAIEYSTDIVDTLEFVKVAVYALEGDYEDEWFYKFDGWR